MTAAAFSSDTSLFIGAVVLIAAPFAAATWTWYKWVSGGRREWRTVFPLVISTASYLLLLSGLFTQTMIGSDYSHQRFVVVYMNLASLALTVGWLAVYHFNLRRQVVTTAVLIAMAWAYLAVVSSAV